jgi:hypothetical protein
VELPTTIRCIEIQPVYDFQRAVGSNGRESMACEILLQVWPAFAADKPQRDYCSDACRKEIHRLAWQERWEKYGKKWRKKQRTRKVRRHRAAA